MGNVTFYILKDDRVILIPKILIFLKNVEKQDDFGT